MEEACDFSLLAVLGTEPGEMSPDAAASAAAEADIGTEVVAVVGVDATEGELRNMAFVRKSVYATGGLMGVFM